MISAERIKHLNRWFKGVQGEFCPLLTPFTGKPINYVEIGCWGGASAEWVARNILTHPDSRGFGLDPYYEDLPRHPMPEVESVRAAAMERLDAAIGDRWQWIRLPSVKALKRLNRRIKTIDVLYIDGDHGAEAVVLDFAFAWPMLRPGSLVIFDDYVTKRMKHTPHVAEGYHAILSAWSGLISPIGDHYRQRAVTVTAKTRGTR